MRIDLVDCGNYQLLYINGKLHIHSYKIEIKDVVDAINDYNTGKVFYCEYKVDEEWFNGAKVFPEWLDDVVLKEK